MDRSGLIKFKKGAFFAEKTVKPVMMKYNLTGSVSVAYDVIEILPLAILQLSWSCMSCKVIELPDFQPNDYLFSTHSDKGTERWEIFAWATRHLMAKEGGFSLCDIPLRDKVIYEGYMQMNKKYPSPYPQSKYQEKAHAATDLEKIIVEESVQVASEQNFDTERKMKQPNDN